MNYNNVIELDIWSSYGCFSKPFSTSGSMLSYLIPPKTSIIGMIGAIVGYDVNDFVENDSVKRYKIEELNDIKISVQSLFDFKSKRVTFNQVYTDKKNIKIKNIKQDILINPYYKVFISFPVHLSNIEESFIRKIKNNETVYNLYMGKNEFLLNYKLCKVFEYESIFLNKTNEKTFKENNMKIYGLLNRKFIRYAKLNRINSINSNVLAKYIKNDVVELSSFYEYILKTYPVKRTNFSDFSFAEISFYSSKNFKDCYFSEIIFKEDMDKNQILELVKIGENEWISMI